MDVPLALSRFNAVRDPERLQLKYRRMRADPFVFFRGSCHLFYQHMPHGGLLKSAPPVWSCGDLHLENFGSYKADNRLPYFDINDFDEGCLAPASWDLVRVLASLQVAGKSLGLKSAETRHLCAAFLDAYGTALARGKAYWVEALTASGLVRQLLDGLRERKRAAFLASRTRLKAKRRWLHLDGERALPVDDTQRAAVVAFMESFAAAQSDPAFYRVLDVARRIAGTGSLGVDRYVILVEGKGSPDGNYLLDLKEALPSSLAAQVRCRQPKWASEAHRVVAIQQRVQAVPMAFLQPVFLGGKSYVLRGLQPLEDRVSLNAARQSLHDIEKVVTTMAHLVAWGQLRSSGREGSATADDLIAYAAGGKWKDKLLDLSRAAARQALQDAKLFNQAYDDGYFQNA